MNNATPSNSFIDLLAEGSFVDPDGEIVVGGCRLSDLANQYQTPLYVIDEGALRARIRTFRTALAREWGEGMIHFASKAFPSTCMYRVMAEEGIGVDVAGGGELVMALAGGVKPQNIVVHGNAKTEQELKMALDAAVGTIVIDNFNDIERLEGLATRDQDVLVRIIPDVNPSTHDALATGTDHSKFGLHAPDARRAFDLIRQSHYLKLRGVHVHIGSQINEIAPFEDAIKAVAALGDFEVYDLGGGLGERYTYSDTPPTPQAWVAALASAARRHLPSSARLLLEPGRSIVARAGLTLYHVVTVKSGDPAFVAVDGGMGDNLEVSLYGQRFEAEVVNRLGHGTPVDLVGRHCESGDRLVADALLVEPRLGDVVAVAVTGAYCFTMSNNYNGALRPAVVFCRDGESSLQVRRENYDDLTRRDVFEN
ncbi:MAG: diaminopimelate decarboxylase [Acidimicrobiales bacterium]